MRPSHPDWIVDLHEGGSFIYIYFDDPSINSEAASGSGTDKNER